MCCCGAPGSGLVVIVDADNHKTKQLSHGPNNSYITVGWNDRLGKK